MEYDVRGRYFKGGMKTQEKQEDKKLNISEENGFKVEKKKTFVIEVEILEFHVKID
jgi:hypothetical protein